MNINLDYEGKHYSFTIPNNAKIDYLKKLSCKLFQSDNALLELICNNKKLDGINDNMLIQDLIPQGKNNTVLTIQMGDEKKEKNSQNLKVTNQNKNKEELKIKKNEKKEENNIKPNSISNINSNNNNKTKLAKLDLSNISNNNVIQVYENRIFIANYIKKSNELFAMMKDFNDKVKETDNKLNRKMKNFDIDIDNNIFYYELSLFEKRLIDFQKRQINYYKELIQILNINNDETKEPNFELFYSKIILNNDTSDEKTTNKKSKSKNFPSIEKINTASFKRLNKIYDTELLNNKLPLLMTGKRNNSINRNNENDDVLKTIDNKKIYKYNNIMEKFKIKNLKLNKLNLKTEKKGVNGYLSDEKEIKYQIEDTNNKSKNNRNTNRKFSKVVKEEMK